MLNTRLWLLIVLLLPGTAVAGLGDDLSRLEKRHELLANHRGRLETQLKEHGRRISRLKAQPRSVARDLQLKAALRSSQTLANKLTSLQQQLNEQRDKLLALYGRAIASAPDAATKSKWRQRRRKLAKRTRGASHLLARVQASPLDSAEDLEEKADLLKDSEEKLRRRIRALGRRIARLERRAKLKRHGRAALDSPFVEQSTRRAGGQRRAVAKAPVATENPPPPAPTDDGAKNQADADQNGALAGEPSYGMGEAPAAPAPGGAGSRAEGEATSPSVTRGLDPATLQALTGKLRGSAAQQLAALRRAQEKLRKLAGNVSAQAKAMQQRARALKTRKQKK